MLKLTASYSKKVPVPESEYSSQSYHCCVEIEIAEGLSKDQLDSRIHETFSIVKNSVENELHGGKSSIPQSQNSKPQTDPSHGQKNADVPASPKQIKFLLDLARTNGVTPEQIKARYRVNSLEELTRTQCSKAIDELNGKAA